MMLIEWSAAACRPRGPARSVGHRPWKRARPAPRSGSLRGAPWPSVFLRG